MPASDQDVFSDGGEVYDDDTISELSFEGDDTFKDDVISASRTKSFSLYDLSRDTSTAAPGAKALESQLSPHSSVNHESTHPRLNTLWGVIIPCIESNMFGVILFMRLPWITAQNGVPFSVLMFALCLAITLLTTCSLNAIATNGKLKKSGGLYHLTRKILGTEIGGGVGVIYVFVRALTVSMYFLAAAELITSLYAPQHPTYHHIVISLILATASMVLLHPRLLKNFDVFTLCFLVISVVGALLIVLGYTLFLTRSYHGHLEKDDREDSDNLYRSYSHDNDTRMTYFFEQLFYIYFPCVAVNGASTRSGSMLATPGWSIPSGNLIVTSLISMLALTIILTVGFTMNHDTLMSNKYVLLDISFPYPIIGYVCAIAACIGAAQHHLVGIPRLLTYLANDDFPFLYLLHSNGYNIYMILLTFAMVSVPCLAGNLNHIALYCTLFLLLLYTVVNFACFLVTVLKTPGFRPQFRYYSWHTAMIGFMLCFAMMMIVSYYRAVVFWAFFAAVTVFISRSAARNNWGDALAGLMFQQARNLLLYMDEKRMRESTNWRPQILVFVSAFGVQHSGPPTTFVNSPLLRLAGQMKKARGLTIASCILEGDPSDYKQETLSDVKSDLQELLVKEGVVGFVRVGVARCISDGIDSMVQLAGIGSMQPNTVLLDWPEQWDQNTDTMYMNAKLHLDRFKVVTLSHKALIVAKGIHKLPSNMARLYGNIDIWWVVQEGGLLLLIPHLLSLHRVWRHCRLRLFVVLLRENENPVRVRRRAEEHLDRVRVEATVEIVDMSVLGGGGSSIYENTLDINARDKLLSALKNPNTITVALRKGSDDRTERHPGISDIFKSFTSQPSSSNFEARPSDEAVVAPPPPTTSAPHAQPPSVLQLTRIETEYSQKSPWSPETPVKDDQILGMQPSELKASSEDECDAVEEDVIRLNSTDYNKCSIINMQKEVLGSSLAILAEARDASQQPQDCSGLMGGSAMSPTSAPATYREQCGPLRRGSSGSSVLVAVALNNMIKSKCRDTKLIVTNLPLLHKLAPVDCFSYVSNLTRNLDPVLLIRGTGEEVITSYG